MQTTPYIIIVEGRGHIRTFEATDADLERTMASIIKSCRRLIIPKKTFRTVLKILKTQYAQ